MSTLCFPQHHDYVFPHDIEDRKAWKVRPKERRYKRDPQPSPFGTFWWVNGEVIGEDNSYSRFDGFIMDRKRWATRRRYFRDRQRRWVQ